MSIRFLLRPNGQSSYGLPFQAHIFPISMGHHEEIEFIRCLKNTDSEVCFCDRSVDDTFHLLVVSMRVFVLALPLLIGHPKCNTRNLALVSYFC